MNTAKFPDNPGFSIMGDSMSTLGGYIPQGWRCHYQGEVEIPGVETMENTWWGQVIDHFGGHLVANASFSGSTVEGFGFPAGCSAERAQALMGPAGNEPDVVLVFMGINDYGWGDARNQVMGASASRSATAEDLGGQEPVRLTVTASALEGFHAAYAAMLANIHAVAPLAQIWCITLSPAAMHKAQTPFVYQARGIELDAYNDAIRQCAHEAGAHLADVRAFGIDYDSVDNTHPTALGMKQLATMICTQIEGAPAQASDYPLLAKAPASFRTCNKTSCEGCLFSPITANEWSLTCKKGSPSPTR